MRHFLCCHIQELVTGLGLYSEKTIKQRGKNRQKLVFVFHCTNKLLCFSIIFYWLFYSDNFCFKSIYDIDIVASYLALFRSILDLNSLLACIVSMHVGLIV